MFRGGTRSLTSGSSPSTAQSVDCQLKEPPGFGNPEKGEDGSPNLDWPSLSLRDALGRRRAFGRRAPRLIM